VAPAAVVEMVAGLSRRRYLILLCSLGPAGGGGSASSRQRARSRCSRTDCPGRGLAGHVGLARQEARAGQLAQDAPRHGAERHADREQGVTAGR
jgi:hypothetical protein